MYMSLKSGFKHELFPFYVKFEVNSETGLETKTYGGKSYHNVCSGASQSQANWFGSWTK